MKYLILALTLLVTSCTTTPGNIDASVNQCCLPDGYKTFTTSAKDIPAFLGPLMMSNFSVAMANHGFQPVKEDGDIDAVLVYEQIDQAFSDPSLELEERIATGDAERFIARIAIMLKDGKTGETLWTGQIERLHDVSPGEFMHTGTASLAVYAAFERVLQDLPVE